MAEKIQPCLCNTCKSALEDGSYERLGGGDDMDFETWKTHRQIHHANIESLQASAASNCLVCARVARDESIQDPSVFSYSETRIRDIGNGSYEIVTEVFTTKTTGMPANHHFAILKTRASENLFVLAKRSRSKTNTGHEDIAALANGWLTTCLGEHESCQRNSKPEQYPRRLLDIRRDNVFLIETDDEPLKSPYATMSHSWGMEWFEVLNRNTADDYRKGKALGDFPRNFHDIMLTARRLSIRYLWIDCYCIMQSLAPDDHAVNQELQQDLASMDRVYANALINFGATASSKPADGCFVKRTVSPDPYRVFWRPTSDHAREEYFLLPYGIHDWENNEFYENTIFTRAWVLQERLLCARMLHFTHSGIYWECKEIGFADELLPLGAPQTTTSRLYSNPFAIDLYGSTILKAVSHEDKVIQLQSAWTRIRSAYTSMHLSFPQKDKLVALAGIAKQMALGMKQSEYIAGFFGKDFLLNLAWVRDNKSEGGRAKTWRAPTWSWASVDGRCFFNMLRGIQLASILDDTIELVDKENKYGALRFASLRIKGGLIEAEFLYGKMKYGQPRIQLADCEMGANFDDDHESKDHLLLLPLVAGKLGGADYSFSTKAERDKFETELFAAHNTLSISGLILQPAKDEGVFQRLGTFGCAAVTEAARDNFVTAKEQVITLI